ncbi:MAG TPA: dodecin family protein [Candidatus Limnocylindrales bacterium]|nr:dodecin family protein [Candidatus Limnocylindrales bacterium]
MSVARVTEISSRSEESFEAAINEGIERANKTLRNVRSAWIKEQSVDIEDGGIVAYRVNMLVTFVLDE